MEQNAIYDKLTEILRNVFDDDDLVARPDLTAAQVDGWDSFAHLRLMLAVEKAFKVNFSASQISGMKNVGELVELIAARVSKE